MGDQVERWKAIINAAQSRRAARDALGCTFAALKKFRADHMPEHRWPDSRIGGDIAREQFEARVRKRKRRAL